MTRVQCTPTSSFRQQLVYIRTCVNTECTYNFTGVLYSVNPKPDQALYNTPVLQYCTTNSTHASTKSTVLEYKEYSIRGALLRDLIQRCRCSE
jgi:hypothetical protein